MGRTYAEWIASQDQALVAKTRAGDEANKPLLNQVNWIWVANLMAVSYTHLTLPTTPYV